MKAILLLAVTLFIGLPNFAFASDVDTTLANPPDFVLLSNVNAPEVRIFLSYTGAWINHCGIAIRGNTLSARAEKLNQILAIQKVDGQSLLPEDSQIENGKVVSKVDPSLHRYGELFVIKTRSGGTLANEIKKLDSAFKTEALVEILPCDGQQ